MYMQSVFFFSNSISQGWRRKAFNLYLMLNRFYKNKDCNHDICLLTRQINYFHWHHPQPISVILRNAKIRLRVKYFSPGKGSNNLK